MGSLRISDADREAAVDLLAEQYAVGRLTKAEFDERSDAAWSARTEGDLAPVFVDLPVRSPISGTARPGREPARRTSGHAAAGHVRADHLDRGHASPVHPDRAGGLVRDLPLARPAPLAPPARQDLVTRP
jgi:hypothetical protein